MKIESLLYRQDRKNGGKKFSDVSLAYGYETTRFGGKKNECTAFTNFTNNYQLRDGRKWNKKKKYEILQWLRETRSFAGFWLIFQFIFSIPWTLPFSSCDITCDMLCDFFHSIGKYTTKSRLFCPQTTLNWTFVMPHASYSLERFAHPFYASHSCPKLNEINEINKNQRIKWMKYENSMLEACEMILY